MKMIAKVIDNQTKQLCYNMYTFFKKRKAIKTSKEHKNDINLIDTVAEATGVSKTTVTRIIREGNAMLFNNPQAPVIFRYRDKVKHVRAKRIQISEHTEGVIRRKVIQFYKQKNEVPSVRRLNALLKEEKILSCSDEYLRQLLHRLGFTNTDEDAQGMYKERAFIVQERNEYIKALKGYRCEGRDIFFLNETERWFDTNDENIRNNKKMPSLVMVHADGPKGFADGSIVMVKMRSNGDQYNYEHFENYDWAKDTILPMIPPKSLIVLNVPQCESPEALMDGELPPGSATRAVIESWLSSHNISFSETDSKAKLHELITQVQSKMKYALSKLFKDNGFDVLYLPKQQQDLNPAAVMWDDIKEGVENASPKESIMNYPHDKWDECFQKVLAYENEYYGHDNNAADTDIIYVVEVKKEAEENEDIELKVEESSD